MIVSFMQLHKIPSFTGYLASFGFTGHTALSGFTGFFISKTHFMSTSFIEETSHTRVDNQNELKVQIQQLIRNNGKDSVERCHRDGYYSGKLSQLNDLWQQFCDLDEEVQQAALATGSEYSSRLAAENLYGQHADWKRTSEGPKTNRGRKPQ